VVVVGAGAGGLSLAARLASLGSRVTVLEKSAVAGGRVGEHLFGGHRWETGASLLLLPDVYRDAVGERLNITRVTPPYSVFFDSHPERGPVVLGGAPALLRERLALEVEEPAAHAKFLRYAATAREYLRAGWPLFIEEDLSPASLLSVPPFLRASLSAPWRWPLSSHDRQLRRLLPSSPRLRALCSFDDLYVGLSPAEAPAVFSLLAAVELDDPAALSDPARPDTGVYYPVGGFGAVAVALRDAAEAAGARVRTGAAVEQVLVERGAAVGVRLKGGEVVRADRVVVNGDLAAQEPRLLNETVGASRDDYGGKRYS
jgi:phytoene dehydrogenase-like protein